MNDLTGFQRDLLYVISGLEEPSGLDVKEELEDYYDEPINHGRLYPNLDELVDEELVEKTPQDRANVYTLTEDGRGLVEDRETWEAQYL